MSRCEICLVRDYAPEEAKDALIAYQAAQLDRLSHLAHGIPYVGPDPADLVWEDDDEPAPAPAPRDALADLEAALWDVYRKPPRVGAPMLLDALAEAGWHLTNGET